jgi:hypothetical protein
MRIYDPSDNGFYTSKNPIPEGKHRIEIERGDFVCIAENHPTCNWTYKRTIISKSEYIKNYKKKNRID